MMILLLGKNGQIGWELHRTLTPLGSVKALGSQDLNLIDEQKIRSTIRNLKPDLIVNAAAYTAVDKAESEPDLAMQINGIAPRIIAEEAALLGTKILHYSTDYVFDGNKSNPYTEEDLPNPVNIYGKTKLAGEEAIRETGVSHVIVRTGWVYGLRGNNFLLTMLRLAAETKDLKIVNDQVGAPTWCRMVAEATAHLLARKPLTEISHDIYHISNAGSTTWHGFACSIMALSGLKAKACPRITAITTNEYITAAKRPLYTVLDNSLFCKHFNLSLANWQETLELALD